MIGKMKEPIRPKKKKNQYLRCQKDEESLKNLVGVKLSPNNAVKLRSLIEVDT